MKNVAILIMFILGCPNFGIAQEIQDLTASELKEHIKTKLLETKTLLLNDNGNLWGHQIWNDSILVIDTDNTIYSLVNLQDSKTEDNLLFFKTIAPNTLSFVNTTQELEGKRYATVLTSYLKNKGATIIHELFHLLQYKFREFKGEPVVYLDETEARILLRLEYQALRNALNAIIENQDDIKIKCYLNDAVLFRKERQRIYSDYLADELNIETLEGMANYTGLKLSAREDKYQIAIKEIDQREEAQTYTRPFPYATGPAYGLLFDYFEIPWKSGIDTLYNFTEIYEKFVLKEAHILSEKNIKDAEKRNNYEKIFEEERKRSEAHDKLIDYYTNLLVTEPVMKVSIIDNNYSSSYDMNGTLTLEGKGIVYTTITGVDQSGGKNFGNFATIEGKGGLGKAGILGYDLNGVFHFVFPFPKSISKTRIEGDHYTIDLNAGWEVIKLDDGNLEIVKY